MIAYPEPLRTHLLRDCTTVCHAWRLTRRDGNVSGFTDHDLPLSFDATAFQPRSGFSASEAAASLGFAVDTVDVEGALSSVELRDEEIEAGLYDDATVETFLVNWRSPADFARIRRATIGKIIRSDGRFVAELKGLMHGLDQPSARYLTRACDAELGDQRCGFDLEQPGFSGTGTVVGQIAPDAFLVGGLGSFAGDWFTQGVLTWTSGARTGRMDRLADHRKQGTEALLFFLSLAGAAPETGDAFTVVAGCDKTSTTCRAKFANHDNFRGFPHLPGNDSAYAYVTDGMVFDGGPLVP